MCLGNFLTELCEKLCNCYCIFRFCNAQWTLYCALEFRITRPCELYAVVYYYKFTTSNRHFGHYPQLKTLVVLHYFAVLKPQPSLRKRRRRPSIQRSCDWRGNKVSETTISNFSGNPGSLQPLRRCFQIGVSSGYVPLTPSATCFGKSFYFQIQLGELADRIEMLIREHNFLERYYTEAQVDMKSI